MSNAISSLPWRLYVIVDARACGHRDVRDVAAAAIQGGADVIQLRDKAASDKALRSDAERLLPLARSACIPLIINDRVDVAEAIGADGVHLGQEDVGHSEARRVLGPARLIGRSTHSVEQALSAQADGADYVGIGPVFQTPTKPHYGSIGTDVITQVVSKLQVPMVCIGGIDQGSLATVLRAGGRCVAVVRAICSAEDPEAATRRLKEILEQFHRAKVPLRI